MSRPRPALREPIEPHAGRWIGVGEEAALGGWGVFVCAAGLIHLLRPNFSDGDTGYHLAVVRLTREFGILHSFPWTLFSRLAEHYADKEFLFHILLVPVAVAFFAMTLRTQRFIEYLAPFAALAAARPPLSPHFSPGHYWELRGEQSQEISGASAGADAEYSLS